MEDKFSYEGLEVYDIAVEDRPFYCRFAVNYGDSKVLVFYTNKSLEGRFFYSKSNNSYIQDRGICQFAMPLTKLEAKRRLKKMAKTVMGSKFGMCEI